MDEDKQTESEANNSEGDKWQQFSDFTSRITTPIPSPVPFECEHLTEDVIIDDITECAEPTSAILNYCKKRFQKPYTHILGSVGLRPNGNSKLFTILGHIQTFIVLILLLLGYILQYLFKFRRDRGYGRDAVAINLRGLLLEGGWFVYIIPNCLHLLGYLTAILVFKIRDNENYQCLTERVFIISAGSKVLMFNLWIYFGCGVLWMLFSASFAYLMSDNDDSKITQIDWLGIPPDDAQRVLKICLIITVCCQDIVQIMTLISYCINCYLLRYYLYKITEKLIHHTIEPLEWMRELSEFQKYIRFLNKNIALPISIFLILNLIYAFSGIIFFITKLTGIEHDCYQKIGSCIGNTMSWIILSLVPFYQAAKLNNACKSITTSGHQIRVRPFVHHNTSITDLDSIILFASSLKISAKLYEIPILGNYLCFVIVGFIVSLLTVGLYINSA